MDPNKLFVIIKEKVYDVTEFKIDHPGGEEVLERYRCKDATRAFIDVYHSNRA